MDLRRQLESLFAILLVTVALVGCARPTLEQVDKEEAQSLLDSRCRRCHSLTRVYAPDYNRIQWSYVLNNMYRGGARFNERERDVMTAYLAYKR